MRRLGNVIEHLRAFKSDVEAVKDVKVDVGALKVTGRE